MVQAVPSLAFDVLLVVQIVFLTTGTVFSVVAVLGYRGTPWGRVLRPLPVVLALLCLTAAVTLLPLPAWANMVPWLFAILGIAVVTYEFVLLSTGRRAV